MGDEAYISRKFRNIRNWIIGFSIAIIGAMAGVMVSYGRTIKTVEHNEDAINTVVREYVPGDFLYEIMRSYDLQVDYLLGLQNGNADQVREVIQEFRQFREDVYNKSFSTTRGVKIVPE